MAYGHDTPWGPGHSCGNPGACIQATQPLTICYTHVGQKIPSRTKCQCAAHRAGTPTPSSKHSWVLGNMETKTKAQRSRQIDREIGTSECSTLSSHTQARCDTAVCHTAVQGVAKLCGWGTCRKVHPLVGLLCADLIHLSHSTATQANQQPAARKCSQQTWCNCKIWASYTGSIICKTPQNKGDSASYGRSARLL